MQKTLLMLGFVFATSALPVVGFAQLPPPGTPPPTQGSQALQPPNMQPGPGQQPPPGQQPLTGQPQTGAPPSVAVPPPNQQPQNQQPPPNQQPLPGQQKLPGQQPLPGPQPMPGTQAMSGVSPLAVGSQRSARGTSVKSRSLTKRQSPSGGLQKSTAPSLAPADKATTQTP